MICQLHYNPEEHEKFENRLETGDYDGFVLRVPAGELMVYGRKAKPPQISRQARAVSVVEVKSLLASGLRNVHHNFF